MVLEIRPVTNKEDCLAWAKIYYPTFSSLGLSCLWLQPPSPESDQIYSELLSESLKTPTTHVFKVIDTDLDDRIIAISKWNVFEKPRPMEEVTTDLQGRRKSPPDENQAALAELLPNVMRSRKEVLGGEPHVILETLLVHPDHHRRGAGSMLMRWGLERMDELGVMGYLEASWMGKGLYEKYGFEKVGELRFEATRFGAERDDVHTVMVRQPRKAVARHAESE